MAAAQYSRDNFRGPVVPLQPVRSADAPGGLDNSNFLSPYYLDYDRLVRQVAFDRQHTVTEYDVARLAELAYRYYGDIRLWWYVGYTNGIVNPFTDMYPGQVLRIAAQDSIDALFRTYSQAQTTSTVLLP